MKREQVGWIRYDGDEYHDFLYTGPYDRLTKPDEKGYWPVYVNNLIEPEDEWAHAQNLKALKASTDTTYLEEKPPNAADRERCSFTTTKNGILQQCLYPSEHIQDYHFVGERAQPGRGMSEQTGAPVYVVVARGAQTGSGVHVNEDWSVATDGIRDLVDKGARVTIERTTHCGPQL